MIKNGWNSECTLNLDAWIPPGGGGGGGAAPPPALGAGGGGGGPGNISRHCLARALTTPEIIIIGKPRARKT